MTVALGRPSRTLEILVRHPGGQTYRLGPVLGPLSRYVTDDRGTVLGTYDPEAHVYSTTVTDWQHGLVEANLDGRWGLAWSVNAEVVDTLGSDHACMLWFLRVAEDPGACGARTVTLADFLAAAQRQMTRNGPRYLADSRLLAEVAEPLTDVRSGKRLALRPRWDPIGPPPRHVSVLPPDQDPLF